MRFFNESALMLVAAGAFMFSACSHETDYFDPNFNSTKAEYENNWKNTFGDVNPEQDWNIADKKSVTVSVSETSTICIFAENGDVNSLVAQFDDFSGSRKVEFDAAETVEKVIVMKKSASGYSAKTIKVGGTADFNGTRTVYPGDAEGGVKVEQLENRIFSADEVTSFMSVLPEIGYKKDYNNLGKVTQNFMYVSNGEFIIYPTYYHSSATVTLGMFYYVNGQKVEKDLWTKDPDTQLIHWSWGWQNSIAYTDEAIGNGATEFSTPEIKVTTPEGMVFGLYIRNGSFTAYSDKSLNDRTWVDGGWQEEPNCYAGTFYQDGVLNVGFEDWTNKSNDSDMDLNDLMCQIYGIDTNEPPVIVDQEATAAEWILACEDLGSTDDFDFNDVVIKVSHVSGQTTAEVTVLEAGGTLPATIYYNGTKITEAHEALGVDTDVMTTEAEGYTPAQPITITVPEDFTITEDMGGFQLYVEKEDKSAVVSVNAPGEGEVPQMICVPATWKWPTERTNISEAYPGFGEWGANWQNNTWYTTPVDGKVINR